MSYNILRFKLAHRKDYRKALKELKNGRKETHWMWYIFPQLAGIGISDLSIYYGIEDLSEAKAYLNSYMLRTHTIKLCRVLLALPTKDIKSVFGYPDYLKLQSCMTLFTYARPDIKEFQAILNKYFGGKRDSTTVMMLRSYR